MYLNGINLTIYYKTIIDIILQFKKYNTKRLETFSNYLFYNVFQAFGYFLKYFIKYWAIYRPKYKLFL